MLLGRHQFATEAFGGCANRLEKGSVAGDQIVTVPAVEHLPQGNELLVIAVDETPLALGAYFVIPSNAGPPLAVSA